MDKKINYEDYYIWHDREIKFDVPKNQLALRIGEKALDTIINIEDSKGNNGDVGTMMFTNLRLLWFCNENVKINLSIGYDCILGSEIKTTTSKVGGETKGLCIKCRYNNNRFEFVFNAVNSTSSQIFTSFHAIYRSYDTSRLYRDMKMKGFLTQDKNPISLPSEKMISKYLSVANVVNEQAVNGTFFITNVRIIWFSNTVDNFNVSLPWIQVKSIKLKDSKHGKLIMFETSKLTSSSVFGFRFNENLENVFKEVMTTYKTYIENPILGVDVGDLKLGVFANDNAPNVSTNSSNNVNQYKKTETNQQEEINQRTADYNKMLAKLTREQPDVEVIESNYFNEQSNMLYYMTSNNEKKNTVQDIVFSPELGLAVEKLPDGVKLEDLWKIIIN